MLVQKEYQSLLDHIAYNSDTINDKELKKSQSKSKEEDVLDSEMIKEE